jgi:hypothetical protein
MSSVHKKQALVFTCRNIQKTETVVKTLLSDHCSIREVSIIGRDFPGPGRTSTTTSQDEKQNRMRELRSFWCRMWRLVPGDAFLNLAGIGSVIVAGPMADSLVEEWTKTRIFATGSPLRAVLRAIGVPSENLARLESVLRRGELLVIAEGDQVGIRAAIEGVRPHGESQLIHNEV